MVSCAACGCSKTSKNTHLGITFHRFPKDSQKRKTWIQLVNRSNWEPLTNSFLCSEHFPAESFDKTSNLKIRLHPSAMPTIQVERIKNVRYYTSTSKKPLENVSQGDTTLKLSDMPVTSTETSACDDTSHDVMKDLRIRKLKKLTWHQKKEVSSLKAVAHLEKQQEYFQMEQFGDSKVIIERLFKETQGAKKVFSQMEKDSTMPSYKLNSPGLSVSKFKLDPYEPKEDEKVINFHLKYNISDDELIESAPIERIENKKEDVYQKNIGKEFENDMEPSAVKKEIIALNEMAFEELNYSYERPFKSEFIEHEEIQIKHEEDNEDRLNDIKCNIGKEFQDDVIIAVETNTENATPDELYSKRPFQPETIIHQEEVHITNEENKGEKLNKRTRKPGNQLVLYQCPECPYSASRKDYLKLHLIRHKRPDEIEWYSCPECPYSAYRKDHLKLHLVRHKRPDEIEWYNCPKCPFKTSRKPTLKTHTEIHNDLMLKCPKCCYKTSRPTNFKQHQIKHKTNVKWLHCPECPFKAHLPSRIQRHVLAHKSDAFKCPKCSYQSRTKVLLNRHQLKHESIDKWHFCLLCSFKTYSKEGLIMHGRRRHSTESNNLKQIEIFKCTQCSYESGSKYSVKYHNLIHHNQNSWFRCSDCVYKTRYKINLKKHMLRHQGENAEGWYRCPECSYKTGHKCSLQCHVLTHKSTDEIPWFECSQCSFKTAYKYYLRRHQLKHKKSHEIDWFCCYECSFKAKQKRYLIRHISSKHKYSTKVI